MTRASLPALLLLLGGCGGASSDPQPAAAPPAPVEPAPAQAPDPVAPVAAEVVPPAATLAGAPAAPPVGSPPAPPAVAPGPSSPSPAPTAAATPPTTPTLTSTPIPASPEAPTASTPPAAPATPPPPTAADYRLDPGKSSLYVQVFKDPDTVASNLSHDHVIVATGWSGTVHWDPSDPAACRIDIKVPVSGLVNDEEAMRKRVGYDTVLDAGQRGEVKDNMLAAGQLDAKSFPSITFTSTRCEPAGDKVKIAGNLSIHGVAKAIAPLFSLSADGHELSASGGFSAKATDFGFQPYSALLGALKNKNEMRFTVVAKASAS